MRCDCRECFKLFSPEEKKRWFEEYRETTRIALQFLDAKMLRDAPPPRFANMEEYIKKREDEAHEMKDKKDG